MPVCLNGDFSSHKLFSGTKWAASPEPSDERCIRIGLVNNMPDAALQATERQFLMLLDSAAGDIPVRLSLYALPDVPRSETGQRHINQFYFGVERLFESHLDGLIVTGAEPVAPKLKEEPYWGSIAKLIDWADQNTHSSIWSCLAAHAAVLHLDGVERRRLEDKRFGVFECSRASDHPLTAEVPSPFMMPHSRWNELREDELTDREYQILTRAEDGSVDAFVKQRKSLFVFFQGHPEYEANTLLLEYRRDVGRYLRGERETYPQTPRGYLDQGALSAATELDERALARRCSELLADFPTTLVENTGSNSWHYAAARLYGNWLACLSQDLQQRLKKEQRRTRRAPVSVSIEHLSRCL